MLKINLLPEGARKSPHSPIEQFHRTPLMGITVGLLIMLALLLALPLTLRRHRLQRLNAKIQVLKPKKQEVEQLQQYLGQLRVQEAAFRALGAGQKRWSQRLNLLSDVTPDGVWFTEFNLDQHRGLVIQGSAIGQGGPEMTRVGRLVQDLKADPEFSSAVSDIQIESVKRIQDHEIEIVQFTLVCSLHAAPAASQ